MVAARESATRAKRLIRNACQKQGIQAGQLTLHQDRGAPMTAKTFSQLLTPVLGKPLQNVSPGSAVVFPLTPDAVHYGRDEIQAARQRVLMSTHSTPSASSTDRLGHRKFLAKCGSINRRTLSNANEFVSKLSREVSHSP